MRYTVEYRFSRLGDLATFVRGRYNRLAFYSFFYKPAYTGDEGRDEDIAILQKYAHQYIPSIEGHSDNISAPRQFPTLRLLCSCHLRDRFDEDEKIFCRDVQAGAILITKSDWPSFLYPETGYNPDDIFSVRSSIT
jgi:hypothetical protein